MLEKKNILLEDYHHWYGEGTNIPLKKVQESRENDNIRSHQNAENYSKIGLVFHKIYS